MLARTHMAFAALAGLLALPYAGTASKLAYFIITIFSGLLPDVDHHGSTVNRAFILPKLIPKFFRHRGYFHSIWILGVGYWILQFAAGKAYALPFAIGYASHLIIDSITKDGINFFYPLKFKLSGPVVTGSWMENVVFGIIIAVFIYLLL